MTCKNVCFAESLYFCLSFLLLLIFFYFLLKICFTPENICKKARHILFLIQIHHLHVIASYLIARMECVPVYRKIEKIKKLKTHTKPKTSFSVYFLLDVFHLLFYWCIVSLFYLPFCLRRETNMLRYLFIAL